MQKILVILISLLLSLMLNAQEVQYEDVVYLKNGSVIRGMIIEQIPNQSLKIKTADRNIFVFEIDQVEKITKEEIPQELISREKVYPAGENSFVPKEMGFESTVDIMLAMNLDWGEPVLGLYASAGYRFFTQLFAGAGMGIEIYDDRTMLPLFLSIRTDFIRAKVTPFFRADLGYAFGWVNDNDGSDWGGIFMDPAIGIRFNISPNFGMNISSGIKFQRAWNHDYYYYPMEEDYNYETKWIDTWRLFTFKIGFSF